MENASKALIIIGSIIITMIIIGLGVYLANMAADSGKNSVSDVEKAEIDSHNAVFEQYFGEHVNADLVKSMLNKVKANNFSNESNQVENRDIYITFITASGSKIETKSAGDIDSVSGKIRMGRFYTVKEINSKWADDGKSGYYKSGFIQRIEIKENKK